MALMPLLIFGNQDGEKRAHRLSFGARGMGRRERKKAVVFQQEGTAQSNFSYSWHDTHWSENGYAEKITIKEM